MRREPLEPGAGCSESVGRIDNGAEQDITGEKHQAVHRALSDPARQYLTEGETDEQPGEKSRSVLTGTYRQFHAEKNDRDPGGNLDVCVAASRAIAEQAALGNRPGRH